MKPCSSCRFENDDSAAFCSRCGSNLLVRTTVDFVPSPAGEIALPLFLAAFGLAMLALLIRIFCLPGWENGAGLLDVAYWLLFAVMACCLWAGLKRMKSPVARPFGMSLFLLAAPSLLIPPLMSCFEADRLVEEPFLIFLVILLSGVFVCSFAFLVQAWSIARKHHSGRLVVFLKVETILTVATVVLSFLPKPLAVLLTAIADVVPLWFLLVVLSPDMKGSPSHLLDAIRTGIPRWKAFLALWAVIAAVLSVVVGTTRVAGAYSRTDSTILLVRLPNERPLQDVTIRWWDQLRRGGLQVGETKTDGNGQSLLPPLASGRHRHIEVVVPDALAGCASTPATPSPAEENHAEGAESAEPKSHAENAEDAE